MTAIDTFVGYAFGRDSSPPRIAAVTPNDDADLAYIASALYCSVAGDVKITTEGGDTVTVPVAALTDFVQRIKRVHETGTTATGIFAKW